MKEPESPVLHSGPSPPILRSFISRSSRHTRPPFVARATEGKHRPPPLHPPRTDAARVTGEASVRHLRPAHLRRVGRPNGAEPTTGRSPGEKGKNRCGFGGHRWWGPPFSGDRDGWLWKSEEEAEVEGVLPVMELEGIVKASPATHMLLDGSAPQKPPKTTSSAVRVVELGSRGAQNIHIHIF